MNTSGDSCDYISKVVIHMNYIERTEYTVLHVVPDEIVRYKIADLRAAVNDMRLPHLHALPYVCAYERRRVHSSNPVLVNALWAALWPHVLLIDALARDWLTADLRGCIARELLIRALV